MEPRGYDYGGGSGAGGKIRRHHASRAAAASPYARPAPAPGPAAAAAAALQGGGWFSRIIAAGASRLLPSVFRKPPPQLTAPAPAPPPPPEAIQVPPSRDLLLEPRPEPLDAPPSPQPPPLEDDFPEGEENSGAIVNDNLCTSRSSHKESEDMLPNSVNHRSMDLEELLKQKTFTRSEFQYLAELLWSRTIGSRSLKPDDVNKKKMPVSEQESGSRYFNLPVDFSTTTYSVADQVASPAEIAKAYMGSKSSKGSPLRLRLHDPSSMPKLMEASMIQKAKPPTVPLLQSSRLHNSKTSDRLESNYTTPNRSVMHKMSSSPYFKSGVSTRDIFSPVSSPCHTLTSVHTSGRQVLKRKSIAVSNETVSVGPIRRVHQRYNRTSPLLETRPGYRRYLGAHGSKLDEGSEQSAQTQKRRCLDKGGDGTLGSLHDRVHVNCGQAPAQSAEMAAKILKQLDTLVPVQKENMSELKKNHLGPSPSELKDTIAAATEKIVDSTSNNSDNEKPPASLGRHTPNLVLSSEIDRNRMSVPSNGFTFPVPAGLGAHALAPPTPTLASPPVLPVEKQQPSAVFSANTSVETHPRISQSVPEQVSMVHKLDNKLNADDRPMPSKSSGQVASFTRNPVFKVVNLKPTSLNNGPGHKLNSTISDIQPSNGSTNSASFQYTGATISTAPPKSTESSSSGGSFTFSNTGIGSLATSNMFAGTSQSVAVSSLASPGTGSPSAPFGFSPLFGTASSSATQDISQAASLEPAVLFGNQNGLSGNSNSLLTQSSANSLSFKSSEKSNNGSLQNSADSQVGSVPMGSTASNKSSIFPWAAGSTSVAATTPLSSAFGSSLASSASLMFGSKSTTTVSPSFGLPNTGPGTSLFSPPPSAVFSFTSSTPSVPNPSPTTPFGGPTAQMNGGNVAADRNGSPFPTASPFGLPSSSPSTPSFSTPATAFSSNTSTSPGIFGYSQQSQASGGFSMGTGGGNDKSSRRIIRVKKRK